MRPYPDIIDTEAIAFGLNLFFTVLFGIVFGVKSARKTRRTDWVTFGCGVGILTAAVSTVLTTAGHWLKWKQLDNYVVSEANAGKVVSIVPDRDFDTYNIQYSNHHSASHRRFHFSLQEYYSLLVVQGAILGIGAAWVGLGCRGLMFRKSQRSGQCRACGYNLTGNTSGVCSECGAKVEVTMKPPMK